MTGLHMIDLNRHFLGIDSMLEQLQGKVASQNYPPYNFIKLNENEYKLELAVTGFDKDDVTIQVKNKTLIIKGIKSTETDKNVEYINRSLSTRSFTREWTLADNMEVDDVLMKNGILTISLKRETQEDQKVKTIKIK